MRMETVALTRNDLAKYPFLKVSVERIRPLNLVLEDLTRADMEQILKRAEEKIEEAILYAKVSRNIKKPDIEISSYPAALLLVAATENSFLKKRYALAVARQAYSDMQQENKEKLMVLSCDFGWRLELNRDSGIPSPFSLRFVDYLRNTRYLSRDNKWKLVNRILVNGAVYLNLIDVARLLQEEVQRRIQERLATAESAKFPEKIMDIAERLKTLSEETIGKVETGGFPKVVNEEAFPPCIVALRDTAFSGGHLSHLGRFTLTSFLAKIGLSSEEIIDLFRAFSDYDERLTRYQVAHIAGERGSRLRYAPPSCRTLKTHGVCINRDKLCHKVFHPLKYYRLKYNR